MVMDERAEKGEHGKEESVEGSMEDVNAEARSDGGSPTEENNREENGEWESSQEGQDGNDGTEGNESPKEAESTESAESEESEVEEEEDSSDDSADGRKSANPMDNIFMYLIIQKGMIGEINHKWKFL